MKEEEAHEHVFNTPVDVFDEDGITHHRNVRCGQCETLEVPEPPRIVEEDTPEDNVKAKK